MKKIILSFLMSSTSLPVLAADFQCFDSVLNVYENPQTSRPAIVVNRVQRGERTVVYTQEVVPLNEGTDNFLAGVQSGQRLCLKGTLGLVAPAKFFAYEAKFER